MRIRKDLSALPIFLVEMAVADGTEATGYFNIIIIYLNIVANYLYL